MMAITTSSSINVNPRFTKKTPLRSETEWACHHGSQPYFPCEYGPETQETRLLAYPLTPAAFPPTL